MAALVCKNDTGKLDGGQKPGRRSPNGPHPGWSDPDLRGKSHRLGARKEPYIIARGQAGYGVWRDTPPRRGSARRFSHRFKQRAAPENVTNYRLLRLFEVL